jgi:hypothetical protein
MRKIYKIVFVIILLGGLTGFVVYAFHKWDQYIEGFDQDKVIGVSLDIGERNDVIGAVLICNGKKDAMSEIDVLGRNKLDLKCPIAGKGNIHLNLFTYKDTISFSDGNVEGGDRIKLKMDGDKIVKDELF